MRRWMVLGVLLAFEAGCLFEPGPLASRQCGTDLDCASNQICARGYCADVMGPAEPDPSPDANPDPAPTPDPQPEGGCDQPSTWYLDNDRDGWGVDSQTFQACERPDGTADRLGDCNDSDSTVSPDADEICDARDNDCDGKIDGEDDDAIGLKQWYLDFDQDGWGDEVDPIEACLPPNGYIAKGGDCDDVRNDISPEGLEVCDGLDNDCDNARDNGTTDCGEGRECDGGGCVSIEGGPCTVLDGCQGELTCFRGVCSQPVSLRGVTGQWDFVDGLTATIGTDLSYHNPAHTERNTDFGTTTGFGIPDMADGPANVMYFQGFLSLAGYRMTHGVGANGGGNQSNQYTLIIDIFYETEPDDEFRAFFQTSADNFNDADFFINPARGIGISGSYHGEIAVGQWYRVAFVVDLTASEGVSNLFKYIDGALVGSQDLGDDGGVDDRWAMGRVALLFADNNAEIWPGHVSSVQIRNYPMSAQEVGLLGAPGAAGIPQ